jgi:thiol:disulfide interchange protein DsbD
MELDRDEFVVAYDSSKVSKIDILAACEKSGFPATVVQNVQAGGSNDDRTSAFTPPPFFSEALATAKSENKPLVLDFMAVWCDPCKRLVNETFVDEEVSALLEKCVFLKIDTDEHPELAKHFNVASLPDIRFLSPEGKEINQLNGFQSPETFAVDLTTLLKSSENDPQTNKREDSDE